MYTVPQPVKAFPKGLIRISWKLFPHCKRHHLKVKPIPKGLIQISWKPAIATRKPPTLKTLFV
ncbi:hypothetical protein PL11201_530144 [Planktothrix sp. PCC 11201]|nr:hypothetical protein PL11201_530144 [Planktothrix sp. PCC 11201]